MRNTANSNLEATSHVSDLTLSNSEVSLLHVFYLTSQGCLMQVRFNGHLAFFKGDFFSPY